MKHAFNIGFALASIVLAFALWTYVKLEAALIEKEAWTVPLNAIGLDQDRYTMQNMATKVAVQLSGTPDAIEQYKTLKRGTAYATVDLSEARPELSSYRIRLTVPDQAERTGVGITLVSDEVPIIIEAQKQQDKEVVVDPYNTPPGLVYASAQVNPNKIRLRGTQRQLDQVDKVRARVDLSRAIGPGITVLLEVLDKTERSVPDVQCIPQEVTVYPQLAKVAPTKTVLISAVFAPGSRPAPGFVLKDVMLVPNTIEVSGEMNQLASLQAIETVPIRLDGLNKDSIQRIRLVIPRGLTVKDRRNAADAHLTIAPIPVLANPAINPPTPGGGNP